MINEMDLSELYYIVLYSNKYGEEETLCDIDMVYEEIGKRYYEENNVYVNDSDVLFNWLKEKAKYLLLDDMMLHMFNGLIKNDEEDNEIKLRYADPFFVSNILELRNIMLKYGKTINENKEEIKLSKMKDYQVANMVRDILSEVDPSLEWLNIYEEMINENRILYVNLLTDKQREILEGKLGVDLNHEDGNFFIYLKATNEAYVLLNYTGTIADVATTIHEVIHYISRYKNNFEEEEPILREFCSTFFELYAYNYLEKMGYDKKEISMINKDRTNNVVRYLDDVLIICDYLIMFMMNAKVSKEYDAVINNDERVDRCTNTLIENPYLLSCYYPYFFGNYLATKGIEQMENDKFLLSVVKYITDKLPGMDAYTVFNLMGCGNANLVSYDENLFPEEPKKKRKEK